MSDHSVSRSLIGSSLFSRREGCLSVSELVESLCGDQRLLVVGQRVVSGSCRFDLSLVVDGNVSRQSVDQSDDVFHRLVLSGKGRGVGHIGCDSRERIVLAVGVGAVRPAGEGVGVDFVLALYGSVAVVFGCCVFGYVCVGFKNSAVVVLPCYGVTAKNVHGKGAGFCYPAACGNLIVDGVRSNFREGRRLGKIICAGNSAVLDSGAAFGGSDG